VQDRAIALHHLDAPWRPADVSQREGRIIRQGNQNEEVHVIRYVTAQSFDGYLWQALERKARFIRDVMSPALTTREIDDIGDTALSFSEAKALATGNPLLMDKTAADGELARLVRAEWAHYRNQDTLKRTITHLEERIVAQTQLGHELDAAITRRLDTRGEAFAMTVEGRTYTRRTDAGQHLLGKLTEEARSQLGHRERNLHLGELGGFPLTASVSRPIDEVRVHLAFTGAPTAEIAFDTDDLAELEPVGLISRLENRLAGLDASRTEASADIDHARAEFHHATASLGKPFPQAGQLEAARVRVRDVEEQLQEAARPVSNDREIEEREAG
jgi:hypothetical protein